ncbi:EAL domain-containing protein [Colwellia sp. 6M3]|jgi:diguanylate cyclase (GGDEF)-like protein|uniref:bifunctional diguanylate cyclase/phosphodiesterase n=1 Tax=Colwellia sp. 6M3 TaxID=2759849 RepID=UPI0015F3C383|nr:EAL domain-containing protein [Colwellia sp. 6M3]MBA6416022.1 EAL domain-containing protein [Colwellia sp. 6M3]
MIAKIKHRSIENKILLTASAAAVFGFIPILFFSIIAQDITEIVLSLTGMITIFIIFLGVLLTNKKNITKFFSYSLAVFSQIIILVAVELKGEQLIYWTFPVIVASFYLLPTLTASIFNGVLITSICYITYQQLDSFILVRIIVTMILTNVFASAFSVFMQNKNRQLSQSDNLNKLRNNILELIASSAPLSQILPAIINGIEKEHTEMLCSILLIDNTGEHLMLGAAPSLPDFYNQAVDGVQIGKGNGSCGTAAFTKERVIVSDISSHPYWVPWAEMAKKAQLGACWSQPIIDSKGELIGTFAIYHRKKSTPKKADFALIEQISNLVRIAIERDSADKTIWHQANFDNLTQLPNRNLLKEHLTLALENAKRDKKQLTIAMLDIDNFKDINDSLGHNVGDELLIESAKRIKNCIRANDIVARLGGDEFIIVLLGTTTAKDIDNIGQNLLTTFAQPYTINEQSVHCTASIGIASYPDDAIDINSLLRNADQAMYNAKNQGRNSIHFFTENMRTDFLKRMEIIKDLRTAITQQQFHMVYQPIVNLSNNKVIKAEALIRWQHPEKGLISPLDFIPIAESTGLIVEISEWIFNEVTEKVKYWREAYCQELMISINTSPVQYKNQGEQISAWVNSLEERNISPKAIAIEITENLLMENQAEVVSVLEQIRKKGVALSIDDFGTGYCSFSYLKNYTIDYLKIDKSFVQNMSADNEDSALCEAIIVMASKLNIDVIAEGIETEQQKQFLIQAGCLYGQGFLLAKPMSDIDFEQLLINEKSC